MKLKDLSLLIGISTFSVGVLSAYLVPSKKVNEVSIKGRLETKHRISKVEFPFEPGNGRFIRPDPLYAFPKAGIYFSTAEVSENNSIFQFGLESDLLQGVDSSRLEVSGYLNGKQIKFDSIEVDYQNRTIILRSKSFAGHRYIFGGQFSDKSYLESEYSRQVVLTGRLEEYVWGRKVSDQYFEFWYAVGC